MNRGRDFAGSVEPTSHARLPPVPYASTGVVKTMPWKLLEAPYSVLLRKAVLKCLAVQIEDRLTAMELLRCVNATLRTFEGMAEAGVPVQGVEGGAWPEPGSGGAEKEVVDLTADSRAGSASGTSPSRKRMKNEQ